MKSFFTKKVGAIMLIAGGVIALYMFASFQKNSSAPSVVRIDAEYAADFSNDSVLVGSSHNIFVAKVLRQIGTKERGIGPETQFEVQVVSNIKGKLQESIVIDQRGGYKDGVLYVVGDDIAAPAKDARGYLLQPGSTYLLATRYNKDQNWYTLNPYPTASKLLSTDSGASFEQLKALANSDSRVQALRNAYPHEVLLEADIKNKNTPNTYKATQITPDTQ